VRCIRKSLVLLQICNADMVAVGIVSSRVVGGADKGPIGSHPDGSRGRVARVDHAAYYLSDGVVGPVRRLLRAVCLSASPSSFVAL
jgi:hypothetical protein